MLASTDLCGHHARAVDPGGLDELEEVDHTLCLHPLQHGMDTDEGTCTAHPITGGGEEEEEEED